MSKAKDRARAESGRIFRDGKLVNKEDWYSANPTRKQRQAKVDKAVAQTMADKFDPKDTSAVIAEASLPTKSELGNRYYCTACRKYHMKTSKVGSEHVSFYLEE